MCKLSVQAVLSVLLFYFPIKIQKKLEISCSFFDPKLTGTFVRYGHQ